MKNVLLHRQRRNLGTPLDSGFRRSDVGGVRPNRCCRGEDGDASRRLFTTPQGIPMPSLRRVLTKLTALRHTSGRRLSYLRTPEVGRLQQYSLVRP